VAGGPCAGPGQVPGRNAAQVRLELPLFQVFQGPFMLCFMHGSLCIWTDLTWTQFTWTDFT
jgi:hypothetical protein